MSFDSNKVCVFNPCAGPVVAACLSLDTVNIAFEDSPFTPDGNVVILVDATGGDVVVNLTVPEDCPNAVYYIKMTAVTGPNEVKIFPPEGELIDGGAGPYILTNTDEVVQFVRNDIIIPDWEVISNTVSSILTEKGDVLSHDGSTSVRLPVGTAGQLLSVDLSEPSGLRWVTSAAAANTIAYHVITVTIDALYTTWTSVGKFAWDDSRYNTYNNGVFVFYAKVFGDKFLDVRVLNGATTLGGQFSITTDGIYNIALGSLPNTDSLVEIQVRRTAGSSDDPQLIGGQLEFQL